MKRENERIFTTEEDKIAINQEEIWKCEYQIQHASATLKDKTMG